MDKSLFRKRVLELVTASPLSEREIDALAKSPGLIKNIRKGSVPSADRVARLATDALKVPTAYLLGEIDTLRMDTRAGDSVTISSGEMVPLRTEYVIGEVQAGHWLEAVEWPRGDWAPMALPVDAEYERFPRFGLVNRGPSMNEHYQDGTVLICVKFIDLGRDPEGGEHVIVHRRRPDGLVEATCKEYVVEPDGQRLLWPRSTHPDFKTPIELRPGNEHSQDEEIWVQALVIGSYQKRPKPEKSRAR